MNVTVYTRHINDCPKKKDRYWRRCQCPKWLAISTDRGFTRQSAKTRSWDKAEQKAQAIERHRQLGHQPKPTERRTIQSAVEKFLKNKQIEGIDDGTYYNQDLAVRKQFLGWTKSKSLVYLDEITLEHLEEFRATLPGNAVTRRYKETLLRGFFRYCVMHRWIDFNPALGLSRIKVSDEPTGYFNREEFAAIRMAAANYYRRQDLPCTELNARLLAFIDCLRWSGIQLHQEKTGVYVFVPGSNFEALIFGYYTNGKLQYVARTRNGFTPITRQQIFKRLKPLEIQQCPFANLPEARSGRWGAGLTAAKMKERRWVKSVLAGPCRSVRVHGMDAG